jgi:hypothetical protein
MAKFLHLQIHDVHQLDHMECKFFPEMESELIDAASGKKLVAILSSREFLDSPFLRTMINPAKEPGISSFDRLFILLYF